MAYLSSRPTLRRMHDLEAMLRNDSDLEHDRAGMIGEVVEVLAAIYARIGPEPEWQTDAACRGQTSVMFPTTGQSAERARALCAGCTVFDECHAWAMGSPDQSGIAAGLTQKERQRQRRRSTAAA